MSAVIRERAVEPIQRLSKRDGRAHQVYLSDQQAAALETDLGGRVRGEVRFDAGSRALYATDASNYRQTPIGVVIPRDAEDVVQAVAAARRHGAPILARGGGTSLAGQCCNIAVVIDFSKYMNRVLAIDPARKIARVQPGTILDDLRDAAEQHHLTFGPDPATHDHCTLGGMIGNNSCGVHSVMAGKTDANVEELEILTYDGQRMRVGPTGEDQLEAIVRAGGRRGEIYAGLKALRDTYAGLIRERFPDIPRRVSGYNLVWLLPEHGFHVARALVGSECTCVSILEATLRLVYSPPVRSLLVLGYPDVFRAGDHIMEVLAHKPVGLEGLDEVLYDDAKKMHLHLNTLALLPDGHGWLMAEFGGETKQEADEKARGLMDELKQKQDAPTMKLFDDPWEERQMWLVRESGLGATANVPGEEITWPGWEDSAVPPEKLGDYLRDFRKLLDQYGYHGSLYGHFGQGCLHTSTDFELSTRQGIARFRAFVEQAADLVLTYGGSLSGEHGDGQARGELLEKMFGPELVGAFREFKAIWDPEWKMNPGKVVDPYPLDSNLRLGPDYRPISATTHFKFPDDHSSFAHATLRCAGVGECRRLAGGTMCPSFMVTREEQHSTRGRARLLFEMMTGRTIEAGWRSEAVKESLDLCLACKGCKGDCPVYVDMATYKAEFLSHYYEGRVRPRSAYAFGLIFYWSRLAALAPGLANFFTQTPLLRDVAKLAGGIAPERHIPAFAHETFVEWFRRRTTDGRRPPTVAGASPAGGDSPSGVVGRRVILWPDTFNNHFHPQTAKAAVEVLEAAGCEVTIPDRWLCCGRPLYDYGMLDQAERMLRDIIDALRDDIRAGTPIVGLEPSCVAVFRDELTNLFPHDQDAHRLSEQVLTLSEFLEHKLDGYDPPKLRRHAIVHGHCHHKAIMKMDAEEALLQKIGLDFEQPDPGCCGMAGSFGFEAGRRYDVSVAVGERILLPAVRDAHQDTLIIADGFSCREQIGQRTSRQALHLAQILQMALREGPDGPQGDSPEQAYVERHGAPPWKAIAGAGALLASGAIAWGLRRLRNRTRA
jgi:FAD/FMN-containing dehydrogenase/Fe-S oxidoreductase